jgi:L-methionine (R)-S-oxide reductase
MIVRRRSGKCLRCDNMLPELHDCSLESALERIITHFAADTGTLHVLHDGKLQLKALHGAFPPPLVEIIKTIPVGKGMAGLAAERREPVTACNLQTDTSGDVRPGAKATGMEGAIVVPMIDAVGVLRGTLGIANRTERTWTDEEQNGLMACARQVAALLR